MDVLLSGIGSSVRSAPLTERTTAKHAQPNKPQPTFAEPHAGAKREAKMLPTEAAEKNSAVQSTDTKVSFHYDERIDRVIVKVMRGRSEEVVRQIPAQEVVEMVAKFRKDIRGLLFDQTE